MTEKLYYADPFLQEFTATVESCEQVKDGFLVTLDRTAFYPEGGGQPADHGKLGETQVTDTKEKDGVIVHLCDKPLPVGEAVHGQIDFARRFDLMQQHSGEHIVSGIICEKFSCDNVGFHIGHDLVTIDFNTVLTWEDVQQVEALANQYIWEDHTIQITHPSPDELEKLSYRSKKALTGDVRIVTWPGADCCACCGTHVQSSGQVGLVKLLSCQKFREGVRIELAAGGRAVGYCSQILAQNVQVSQLLSAKPLETAAAVERLQKENYILQGRVAELEKSDFQQKAAQYAGAGDVLLFQGSMSPASLRRLCTAVLETCLGRCAVFAGEDGAYQYAIGEKNGDLKLLVKDLNVQLSGRGGGKPNFVQGSVQASQKAIQDFFAAR
jgi:alanyl-tRNA synthetase